MRHATAVEKRDTEVQSASRKKVQKLHRDLVLLAVVRIPHPHETLKGCGQKRQKWMNISFLAMFNSEVGAGIAYHRGA